MYRDIELEKESDLFTNMFHDHIIARVHGNNFILG